MLRKNKSVGDLIRYYRIMKGYSQNDLAQRLNVTVAAISNWERGVSKPGVDIAIVLTREMQMSLDEFYTISKNIKFADMYAINDLISFEHVFVNIANYDIDLEASKMEIALNLKGLSLVESVIQEEIHITIETQDSVLKPVKRILEELAPQGSTMSPELSTFPITARMFSLKLSFKFPKLVGYDLIIAMHEQSTKIHFSECFNDLIEHGLNFNKDYQENIKRIKSDDFVEYLSFISKTKGFSYIRDYLLKEYLKIIPQSEVEHL